MHTIAFIGFKGKRHGSSGRPAKAQPPSVVSAEVVEDTERRQCHKKSTAFGARNRSGQHSPCTGVCEHKGSISVKIGVLEPRADGCRSRTAGRTRVVLETILVLY